VIWTDDLSDEGMDPFFVDDLRAAEKYAGFTFEITSAFREGDLGCHGRGLAVDIRCWESKKRMLIFRALTKAGFCRIGLYNRHVHADKCVERPSDVLWLGVSK